MVKDLITNQKQNPQTHTNVTGLYILKELFKKHNKIHRLNSY